jgi:hypothetical protein
MPPATKNRLTAVTPLPVTLNYPLAVTVVKDILAARRASQRQIIEKK